MTDISEKETFEYFKHGAKKASDAAAKLATLNERDQWFAVVRALDQMSHNADKLYTAKAMTRLQTLALANKIQAGMN